MTITYSSKSEYSYQGQWHPAICAKCKKRCEVPFEPQPDREVFCQNCYNN